MSDSRDSILRQFRKAHREWPTFLSDSAPVAEKAFFTLTEDEREAACAAADDYVRACKGPPRLSICSFGVYLKEKRWEKLPARTVVEDRPKVAAPFGKAWGARRLRLLLGPMANLPPFDKYDQMVIDSKPEKWAMMDLNRRLKHGWPEVIRMHERPREPVSDEDVALGEGFVQVPVGGDLWHAWKRLHEARGWPWLPDPGRHEWVWMPAPHVQTGDFDEAVSMAIEAFRRRVEGEQHAAAE